MKHFQKVLLFYRVTYYDGDPDAVPLFNGFRQMNSDFKRLKPNLKNSNSSFEVFLLITLTILINQANDLNY
jgi:hypothetical protein